MLLVPAASVAAADGLNDERARPAPGPRPRGLLVRDRGRPRERRPHRHRRAPDLRRRRLADAVRHAGRAGDGLAQGIPAVRAAALVRRQHEGRARQRRRRSSPRRRSRSPSTTRASSSWAWSPRTRPASSAQLDLLPNQNGLAPVIVAAGRRRPAGAGPGLGAPRPADLAGRRRRVPDAGPARGAAHLDRRRRPPRDRRRDRRGGRRCRRSPTTSSPIARPRCIDVDPAVAPAAARRAARRGDAAHGPRRRPGRRAARSPTSGDRVIAADAAFGSGSVTLLGFDPDDELDRRRRRDRRAALAPAPAAPIGRQRRRSSDDQTIVSAVANLPSLALPPIGGLLVLLFGYIVLVGPVNYLVLRRLDRREWAWVTVPALIARVHGRVVRDRGAAPRLGRDHPRGRDRPRRPGHGRGDGPVVPRDLQPVARRPSSCASPATPCSRRR